MAAKPNTCELSIPPNRIATRRSKSSRGSQSVIEGHSNDVPQIDRRDMFSVRTFVKADILFVAPVHQHIQDASHRTEKTS